MSPPTPPRWATDKDITDDQIGYAIRRGVDHLLSHVKDGQIAPIQGVTQTKYAGRNAPWCMRCWKRACDQ